MVDPDPFFWTRLFRGFVGTLVFGLVGILLASLGIKIFDWITPRLDFNKELGENKNVAVGIFCAGFILGICYIVATAIH